MKTLKTIPAFFLCIAAALNFAADEQKPPPAGKSPEVHSDGTITFRLLAPAAKNVIVYTEWDTKKTPLTADEKGVWSVTLGPVKPNVYGYIFNVDGVPLPDPQNLQAKQSTPAQSLVEVGDKDSFCALREVPHGDIHVHQYFSKSLGVLRRMHVYTPPGYDEDAAAKFPVFYLLHGSGDNDSSWYTLGRANLILDNLISEKKAVPMIVVMPMGHAKRAQAPQPATAAERWKMNMAAFSQDFLEDLVPFVEKRYRVVADRDHRAIAGLSMGGMQSVSIGLQHPDQFSAVGAFSGVPVNPDDAKALLIHPDELNKLKLLWVGCGKSDKLCPPTEAFIKLLQEASIKHVPHQSEGFHHWPLWRDNLNEFYPLLFRD